jgi:hypothetical protein
LDLNIRSGGDCVDFGSGCDAGAYDRGEDWKRKDNDLDMNCYSNIEIFTLLFATMGPIKVLVTFAEKTQGLDKVVKRRIALNAVWVAAVVGLIFIYFGFVFMQVF